MDRAAPDRPRRGGVRGRGLIAFHPSRADRTGGSVRAPRRAGAHPCTSHAPARPASSPRGGEKDNYSRRALTVRGTLGRCGSRMSEQSRSSEHPQSIPSHREGAGCCHNSLNTCWFLSRAAINIVASSSPRLTPITADLPLPHSMAPISRTCHGCLNTHVKGNTQFGKGGFFPRTTRWYCRPCCHRLPELKLRCSRSTHCGNPKLFNQKVKEGDLKPSPELEAMLISIRTTRNPNFHAECGEFVCQSCCIFTFKCTECGDVHSQTHQVHTKGRGFTARYTVVADPTLPWGKAADGAVKFEGVPCFRRRRRLSERARAMIVWREKTTKADEVCRRICSFM